MNTTYDNPKRVKLIYTNDKYTDLKPGDMGWADGEYNNRGERTIFIKWDNGSTLNMILGVDQIKFIGE